MIRNIDGEIEGKNHRENINQSKNKVIKISNYLASIQSKFDLLNSTLKTIKNP
jgi:hypothetical protein